MTYLQLIGRLTNNKKMQNINKLPPCLVTTCYLPGLGKHLIFSPVEKVTEITYPMDWFRLD